VTIHDPLIHDPLLPAAAHLTGPGAVEVLRPAVEAAGGELVECRTLHVQYRPESDLVVRYRCAIRRDGAVDADTLLAATTVAGPPPGTLPIEAQTSDGVSLAVGVWRWPFDPILTDLTTMVTPHLAGEHLDEFVGGDTRLDVVAYRPTERAVVRASGRRGAVYVKVLPPASVAGLVARHGALRSAGLPVPQVLGHGHGWIALEALEGSTLRERLKSGRSPLPDPDRYRELLHAFSAVTLEDELPMRSRLDDTPHHASMLAAVLPRLSSRLTAIADRLAATPTPPALGTVHGDLHEAQLVVDDTSITGVLDIDDVGRGDLLDDVGTLVGHLRFRALSSDDARIDDYARAVRRALSLDVDDADVDRHIAAVLVGLATGPFRIQQDGWEDTTTRVVDLIEHHLALAEHPSGAATR
jgi:aminoglycoside phosphotransferase